MGKDTTSKRRDSSLANCSCARIRFSSAVVEEVVFEAIEDCDFSTTCQLAANSSEEVYTSLFDGGSLILNEQQPSGKTEQDGPSETKSCLKILS